LFIFPLVLAVKNFGLQLFIGGGFKKYKSCHAEWRIRQACFSMKLALYRSMTIKSMPLKKPNPDQLHSELIYRTKGMVSESLLAPSVQSF
jgi:hypothetical protein